METKGLKLVEIETKDSATTYKLVDINRAYITRYKWAKEWTLEKEENWIKKYRASANLKGSERTVTFKIVLDDKIIGKINGKQYKDETNVCVCMGWIDYHYRNQGIFEQVIAKYQTYIFEHTHWTELLMKVAVK